MLMILNREDILGLAFLIRCTDDYYEYLVAIDEFKKLFSKLINIHSYIEEAKAIFDYRIVKSYFKF